MEELSQFIQLITESESTDSKYNYVLDMKKTFKQTPQKDFENVSRPSYINFVFSNMKSMRRGQKSDDLKDFIGAAYDYWIDKFSKRPSEIPFRLNQNGDVKLSRSYVFFHSSYKNGTVWPQGQKSCVVGGVKITLGNGLGKGEAGMKYEKSLLEGIKQYIVNGCTVKGLNCDPGVISALENISKTPELRDVLDIISVNYKERLKNDSKNPQAQLKFLDQFIQGTGKLNTKRKLATIIPPKDFNYNTSQDMKEKEVSDAIKACEKNLWESGDIIADIMIVDPEGKKDSIYFSVKETRAQLSGVHLSPSKKDSDWMAKVLGGDVEDKLSRKQFDEFWSMLGIDPEGLIDIYKEKINPVYDKAVADGKDPNKIKGDPISLGKILNNKPSEVIGNFIQRLIGGNYWYISPEKLFFVDSKVMPWIFKAKNARVTPAGKTITIVGEINNIRVDIAIRSSDGGRRYPFRVFPKVDLEKLLEASSKNA